MKYDIHLLTLQYPYMYTRSDNMAYNSESYSQHPCVACLSMLIGLDTLVIMILGSVCLNSGNYDMCGGTRNGAIAMTVIGATLTGLAVLVLVLITCACCCAVCCIDAADNADRKEATIENGGVAN